MGKKPKVIDPLAAVKEQPAKVTRLALNPAASRNEGKGVYDPLPQFPAEIFACKNLVELEVFRGIVDGTIPARLGSLTKLQTLSIGGLDTERLPNELGALANLQNLELAYLDSLSTLPSTIGKLAKLRELTAQYVGLTKLPATIGLLRALRVLVITDAPLETVPAELWQLTGLEQLTLPGALSKMPRGIAALTKLKSLGLSPGALASCLPELAALKSLGEITIQVDDDEVNADDKRTLFAAAKLPALKTLDPGGMSLSSADQRALNKLMKLPPAKRAAAS